MVKASSCNLRSTISVVRATTSVRFWVTSSFRDLVGIDVGAEAVGDGSEAEIKSTENGLAVAADDDDAEFLEIGERFDALADGIRDVPEADVEGDCAG